MPIIGDYIMKQKMLDDRHFPRMHLDLQRLLQVLQCARKYMFVPMELVFNPGWEWWLCSHTKP